MRLAFAKYATSAAGKGVSEGRVGEGLLLYLLLMSRPQRDPGMQEMQMIESHVGVYVCTYIERYMQIADMTI